MKRNRLPVSFGLGGAISGAISAAMCGGNIWKGVMLGFVYGFGSGIMIGVLNRQFMIDGTINRNNPPEDGVIALTSNDGNIINYLWSILVGGYSHVTGVQNGRIVEYGKIYNISNYEGRDYLYVDSLNIDVSSTTLGGNKYNYWTNNCSTSMSSGLGISSQWTPYNIYGYYNFPQLGYYWRYEQ